MENIKFIRKITDYVDTVIERKILGNCVYYNLQNGNKIKLWCDEDGVGASVINKMEGKVDGLHLPFANYFKATQCSPNAPKWYQHIDNGRWYFSQMYTHVLPTDEDYQNIANAIKTYIEMYQ